MVKGVKLVMCNAYDQDTCHYMSGEFEGKASTRVEAKLCPIWSGPITYGHIHGVKGVKVGEPVPGNPKPNS